MSQEQLQEMYEDLFESALEALMESGFHTVRVTGLEEFGEPDTVKGFTPDLQAKNKKGITFLFDVAIKEMFDEEDTAKRLTAFAIWAAENDAQFILIVPEGEEGFATAFVEDLEIPEDSVEVWEA